MSVAPCISGNEVGTEMEASDGQVLQPELERAEKALEIALDETCGVDVRKVNTDEIIRIEETLAVAGKAAKQIVSVRLRRRKERAAKAQEAEVVTPPQIDIEVTPSDTHRVFDDFRGRRWHVFAVRPSSPATERGSLPDDYRGGWLTFESGIERRRVAPIPAGWDELPIDELRNLCAKAERSGKRVSGPRSKAD